MARQPVQVPGASAPGVESTEGTDAAPDKDAEIAHLRAQLAAAQLPRTDAMVFEADGPNTRKAKAQSKHLHLTSAELHAALKAGEVKLTDHHVLCKDGWFVNPGANAQHNG